MDIHGTLRSDDGKGVVHLEARYDATIDRVWSAMTDPKELARWFAIVDGSLRPGGDFTTYVEVDQNRGINHVVACEPRTHLTVTNRETDESYEAGQGVAPFEALWDATLTDEGGTTFVVFEVSGIPLDKVQFYGVGWQLHGERLDHYLATGERADTESRWPELLPGYEKLAAALR